MNNYFTIKELCKSDTARKLNINNEPSDLIKLHLQELIIFLNPLREEWGSPIRVNSGYRCPELNEILNGSKTSAHMRGFAADLYPVNSDIWEFKKFCVNYLKDKDFDQCILETSGNSEWVHIGLYDNNMQQRKEIKNLYV